MWYNRLMPQHKCPACSSNLSFKHYLKNGFKKYPECPYCLKSYECGEIGFKTIFIMQVLFHLTCIISILIERKYKILYLLDFSAFAFIVSTIFIGYFFILPKNPSLRSSSKGDFRYFAKIFAINGIISVLFFSIIIVVLSSFKEQIKFFLS